MTIKKIRSVVSSLLQKLEEREIPKKRMGKDTRFSPDHKKAQQQMLAHAHWLLAVSMKELLADKSRTRSRSGQGKIGRHLGSAQTLLWTAGICTRADLMNQNRKDLPTQK